MDALQKIANLIRDPNVTLDTTAFLVALLVSLVVAFALSQVYQIFFENRATGSQVHRSFILLGPSITALFIAIQYSLPLSLGLLGALSIIRFRTPIKEPEEVGFIMLLVACSVVTATFQLLLLLALITAVTVGLTVRRLVPTAGASARSDGIILVSYSNDGDHDAFPGIKNTLESEISRAQLESISDSEGMAMVQFSFRDLSSESVANLRRRLGEIGGFRDLKIYFNRATSLL
jgi:hypothetical protein